MKKLTLGVLCAALAILFGCSPAEDPGMPPSANVEIAPSSGAEDDALPELFFDLSSDYQMMQVDLSQLPAGHVLDDSPSWVMGADGSLLLFSSLPDPEGYHGKQRTIHVVNTATGVFEYAYTLDDAYPDIQAVQLAQDGYIFVCGLDDATIIKTDFRLNPVKELHTNLSFDDGDNISVSDDLRLINRAGPDFHAIIDGDTMKTIRVFPALTDPNLLFCMSSSAAAFWDDKVITPACRRDRERDEYVDFGFIVYALAPGGEEHYIPITTDISSFGGWNNDGHLPSKYFDDDRYVFLENECMLYDAATDRHYFDPASPLTLGAVRLSELSALSGKDPLITRFDFYHDPFAGEPLSGYWYMQARNALYFNSSMLAFQNESGDHYVQAISRLKIGAATTELIATWNDPRTYIQLASADGSLLMTRRLIEDETVAIEMYIINQK